MTEFGTEAQSFLTTSEVAQVVRAPAETVRFWRHVGKGPRSFKVGRRVLYKRGRSLMADEEDETVDMNQLLRMHTLATARSQAWARRILGEDNDPADTPDDDGGAVA